MGIANGEDYQLVLADLPGFQRPLDALTERMQRTVDQSLQDVEAVLLALSARERIGAGDRFIAQKVFALGVPVVIVLNKVDRLTDKVVRATIFVETDSQKQIVVGKGGSIVKKIGTRARPEIEHLLGHPVFLDLKVKARPKWRRDEAMLERLGI